MFSHLEFFSCKNCFKASFKALEFEWPGPEKFLSGGSG